MTTPIPIQCNQHFFNLQVIAAVHELMGCHAPIGRKRQFVDEVFSNMGGDEEGQVTREMFLAFFNRVVVSL